jgi:glucose/arabinose dehydrogenase
LSGVRVTHFSKRLSALVIAVVVTSFALLPDLPSFAAPPPPVPDLPPPTVGTFRPARTIGWPADQAPTAPPGFTVRKYAGDLDKPRWLLTLPNGDVLVSQSRTERLAGMPDAVIEDLQRQGVIGPSANNIILLRQSVAAKDAAITQSVLVDGLNLPHGMLWLNDHLYIATTDALLRFPFKPGQTRIDTPAEILLSLPAGEQVNPWNNHWSRNVIANADGSKLYLTIGAGTNANESGTEHPERAAIWEINPDGTGKRLFATGLRNPVGIDFEPESGALWTTVNERDNLGDDVPPDYMTSVVDGAFYGWPWVYFGTYPDPFHATANPRKVAQAQQRARVPDLALGGHSVPLGLHFYRGESFPDKYRHGAFVARRGGVGRSEFMGYDVIFVPFEDGMPTGQLEPFLGGFFAATGRDEVYGRPVGLEELPDGSLLVSDDAGNAVWHISYQGP